MPDKAVAEIGKLLNRPNINPTFARELLSVVARLNRPEAA